MAYILYLTYEKEANNHEPGQYEDPAHRSSPSVDMVLLLGWSYGNTTSVLEYLNGFALFTAFNSFALDFVSLWVFLTCVTKLFWVQVSIAVDGV